MNCVDAGNAFVHLFSQTKTRYVLTNKKLQYLVIIAQMARVVCGKTLFDDDIRNFKYGFVLDAIADNFVSGSEIIGGIAKNAPIKGNYSDFVLPYVKKKMYQISVLPTEEEQKLLVSVFLSFGAYNEAALGELLNGFGPLREVPSFKAVPKEKIRRFFLSAAKKGLYSDNAVLSFLKTEYLGNKAAAKKLAEDKAAKVKPEETLKEVFVQPVAESLPVTVPESIPVSSAEGAVQETLIEKTEEPRVDKAAEPSSRVPELQALTENNVQAGSVESDGKPVSLVGVEAQGEDMEVAALGVLRDLASLNSIVVGKKYTVFVEVPSSRNSCEVFVKVPSLNFNVPGVLRQVTGTLYSYTFDGVAADIKISARIV